MKTNLLLFFILLNIVQITQAQKTTILKAKVDKTLIKSGKFKNYYQYKLGDFDFLNGRFENNLKFKIRDNLKDSIVFNYNNSQSEAMILKPIFFITNDLKIILIMIEIAAEYSWGQELVLINNGKITKLAYLDYAVNLENGLSISDYCKLSFENGKIILTFENVPIIYWPEQSKIINGNELKFIINNDKIERIK
ncbi:MAG: hypothetical protein JXR51_04845 [Bacteroidales bacterium]|nr:hypothetical protein [Bacteroidales bacterium]